MTSYSLSEPQSHTKLCMLEDGVDKSNGRNPDLEDYLLLTFHRTLTFTLAFNAFNVALEVQSLQMKEYWLSHLHFLEKSIDEPSKEKA